MIHQTLRKRKIAKKTADSESDESMASYRPWKENRLKKKKKKRQCPVASNVPNKTRITRMKECPFNLVTKGPL